MKSINNIIIIILSIIIIGSFSFYAWGNYSYIPNEFSPLGKGEHPRIYISTDNLPTIIQRIQTSYASQYDSVKGIADYLATIEIQTSKININVRMLSLTALLEREQNHEYSQYVDKIKEYITYILVNSDPWAMTSKHNLSEYAIADLFEALAISYDWLFEELNATEKEDIADFLINMSKGLRGIERPDGLGAIYSHTAFNNRLSLTDGSILFGALTVYGDGILDDATMVVGENTVNTLQYFLGYAEDVLKNQQIAAYNTAGRNGGGWHEGWGYIVGEGTFAIAKRMWVWKTATGEDVFASCALQDMSKYILYTLRPDGTTVKLDDTNDSFCYYQNFIHKWGIPVIRGLASLLATAYNDGYAQYIANFGNYPTGKEGNWDDIVFYTDTIPPISPSGLPLDYHAEGMGLVVMRSGWTDENDVHAIFQNRDYWGSHGHDAWHNSFAIFKNGSNLVIHDGNYPSGASSAASTNNYYRRTISSNSILVFDPNEIFFRGAYQVNDGGQLFGYAQQGGSGYSDQNYEYNVPAEGSEFDTADLKFESTDDYTYSLGDASNSYNKNKVSNFTRQFVYLKPDLFVVFDRVTSTNPNFKKKWLLHSISEPNIIDGTIKDVEVPNHIETYEGTNTEIINGMAKLHVKTLLPTSPIIRKVGGEGYEFWVDDAGENIPPKYHTSTETGGWRIEISPPIAQNDDIFLHVLSTTDVMPDLTMIDGTNIAGVHLKDSLSEWLVVFSNTETDQAQISYSISTSQTVKHLIADLYPYASYEVYQDGAQIDTVGASEAGTIYFNSIGGGSFQITGVGVNNPPTVEISAEPTNGTAFLTVQFTAIAQDSDGTIVSYSWSFGDGNTSTEQNPIHIYTETGTNIATLTVTDNEGAQASDTIEITVVSDSTPPTIPQELSGIAQSDSSINLTWQASSDPETGVDSYKVYRDDALITTNQQTSYTDTGLTENTTYSYQVSAVNGSGVESEKSSSQSITTLAVTPLPPPIAHWTFDEGIGQTAQDTSGQDNHGTIHGAVWTTGKIGGALTFDGEDDYVSLTSNISVAQNQTVALWIKAGTIVGIPFFLNPGYLKERWPMYMCWGGVHGDAGTTFSPGQWYHLAFVIWPADNGTLVEFFLNGVSQSTATSSHSSETVTVIGQSGSHSYYWDGLIDDVRIYDGALSARQIQKLYQGIPGKPGKPIHIDD